MLADQTPHAADAGADDDRDALRAEACLIRFSGEAGVRPCLARGDHRGLLCSVQPPGLDAGQHLGRIHCHLGRDAHLQVGGPVLGEGHDTRPPFEQAGPERRHIPPEGSSSAKASDDDVVDHGAVLRAMCGTVDARSRVELSRSSGCN